VAVVDLVGELRTGELHLRGVHHDHEVAGVDVRGEGGLVLPAENVRNLRRNAPEHPRVGVDDEPASCRECILARRHVRVFLHFRNLSRSGADETRTRDLLRDRQAF
jgi:hypothetical protein